MKIEIQLPSRDVLFIEAPTWAEARDTLLRMWRERDYQQRAERHELAEAAARAGYGAFAAVEERYSGPYDRHGWLSAEEEVAMIDAVIAEQEASGGR
jgi:hypothetical protein